MTHLLFAALVVAAPAPVSLPHRGRPLWLAPLARAAVALELIDPREARYCSDFVNARWTLWLLWDRWWELLDAPPLCDVERWPCKDACNGACRFNREHLAWLNEQAPYLVARRAELAEAVTATNHLYSVWDTARDAQCGYYHVSVRRQSLARLRELLGPDAYYRGAMPPPVPLKWFSRVD